MTPEEFTGLKKHIQSVKKATKEGKMKRTFSTSSPKKRL